MSNVFRHNQNAWNKEADEGGEWSSPVSGKELDEARAGNWTIRLTPNADIPKSWFPPLGQSKVLCLGGGGGQQGPVLAAAGADVTVFDASFRQLELDRKVAGEHGLRLVTELGDMADLSAFDSVSFDLIVHPCSNCFVPNLRPVWNEAARVLRPGGVMMTGFLNPVYYLFDRKLDDEQGVLELRHALPFSDPRDLDPERYEEKLAKHEALEFGHSWTQQIGWQLEAGFLLTDFFEDSWSDQATALNRYTSVYGVTRSIRKD